MGRPPKKIEEVAQLKALTHPLRVRLLYALRAETSATASHLGHIVDESPASVSYHLRKLADAGLVAEAPDLGTDGRERWWRIPDEGFSWSPTDFSDSPEARTASVAAKRVLVDNQFRRQREFDDTAESWGEDWVHGAFSFDNVLELTPAEITEMYADMESVIDTWRSRGLERTARGDGLNREHVMVFSHGFPFRA